MSQNLGKLLERVHSLNKELSYILPKIHGSQASNLQLSIINYLGANPKQSVPQIASFQKSSRQNIQVVVNELLSLGIIIKIAHTRHKTSHLLKLSRVGEEIYTHYQKSYKSFLEKITLNIDDTMLQTTISMLENIENSIINLDPDIIN